MHEHAITAGDITVGVWPARGGRVGQITVAGTELLVGPGEGDDSIAWGAYPMVPWAGRLRHGRFEFRGTKYELLRNHGDHAMHGVGLDEAWSVVDVNVTRTRLSLQLPTDDRWPFGGHVEQTISVDDGGLDLVMTVSATTDPFPAAMGWHPWFRKPDALFVHAEAMYRRDGEGIAVDELIDVPDHPWDDCFIVRSPIGLTIGSVDVELTATTDHWVIYDEQEHATCVEPQTGPPDAFTIAPSVVEIGDSMALSFRIDVVVR